MDSATTSNTLPCRVGNHSPILQSSRRLRWEASGCPFGPHRKESTTNTGEEKRKERGRLGGSQQTSVYITAPMTSDREENKSSDVMTEKTTRTPEHYAQLQLQSCAVNTVNLLLCGDLPR